MIFFTNIINIIICNINQEQAAALLSHFNNGDLLLGSNRYAEALSAFEAGLALDPTDVGCQEGLTRTRTAQVEISEESVYYCY